MAMEEAHAVDPATAHQIPTHGQGGTPVLPGWTGTGSVPGWRRGRTRNRSEGISLPRQGPGEGRTPSGTPEGRSKAPCARCGSRLGDSRLGEGDPLKLKTPTLPPLGGERCTVQSSETNHAFSLVHFWETKVVRNSGMFKQNGGVLLAGGSGDALLAVDAAAGQVHGLDRSGEVVLGL